MSMIDRSLDGMALLSGQLGALLKRRLREAGGIALISLAMMAALALATWSVQDPSLSHATDAPVHNLLGRPGAIAADLMMQLLGLGSLALLLPIGVWGYRLLGHRPLSHERLRVLLWLFGAVLMAAFASCLPHGGHWPLPSGLGGVVGDAMLRVPAMLFGVRLAGTYRMATAIVLGIAALVAFGGAAGIIWRDAPEEDTEDEIEDEDEAEDADESAWISLGRLTHALLSFRARLARAFGRRTPTPIPSRRNSAATRSRIEPQFDQRSDLDVDEAAEDEEDAEERPRAARKPRARRKPAAPVRRRLRTAVAQSADDAARRRALDLERRAHSRERDGARRRARRFRRARRDHQCAAGTGGHALRARAGARHQILPRDQPGRRHRPLDERALRARRRGLRPQRHRHRIAEPDARESLSARIAGLARLHRKRWARLPLCLGKAIGGEAVLVDLSRMPHLLIAGTTGSGKSVAINTMILSLVYRLHPDQCRLIMVDPKMLELSVYDGIPHLLTPVVTDPKKAVVALKWAVREMEQRYKKMSKLGVRNIDGYNARVAEANKKGEKLNRTVHTGYDKESGEAIYENEELDLEPLPYIVVIVDEMADLMMVAGKDIEGAVQRLAQMARAAGLHVILATQRPSVDVITGTIKANFPTRISFQVTSKIDSRTILGEQGAEQLLGQGDMLYMAGGGRISRVHGPFVSDEEVEKVVRHLKTQGVPQYLEAVTADDARGRRRPGGVRRHRHGRRRRRRSLSAGGAGRDPRPQSLHQLYPAPAADRLQPRRFADGAHGAGRRRRAGQPRRQARDPRREPPNMIAY